MAISRRPNGVDVAIRLLIWGICVVALVILSGMALNLERESINLTLEAVQADQEPPDSGGERRRLDVAIVAVFGLSLLSLMWPRVPWGLAVFGVLWAFLGGLWVDLFVRGWVWGWMLKWALGG